ncbi:MAG: HNH endonuclease [Bryobacteraceae bacterium]
MIIFGFAREHARACLGVIFQPAAGPAVNLLNKCSHCCSGCGVSESDAIRRVLTADHVRPVSKGGSNSIRNIQPLCGSCNAWKRQRFIEYRQGFGSPTSMQQVVGAPAPIKRTRPVQPCFALNC